MIEARPFEEYKEMIKDMRKEEMIKGLYDLSKNVIEKENEIERLTISLQTQEELTMNEHIKVEKLRSIIKEVREYIEDLYDVRFTDKDKRKILEILDKDSDDNE